MSKQEEIREGLFDLVTMSWGQGISDRYLTMQILSYLHSQGCVIKVDRELPHKPKDTRTRHCFTTKEELHAFDTGYFSAVQEVIRAGYVATEPLVEE